MNSIVQLLQGMKNSSPEQMLSNPMLLQALGLKGKSQQELIQLVEKATQMTQGKSQDEIMGIAKNLGQQRGVNIDDLRRQLGI